MTGQARQAASSGSALAFRWMMLGVAGAFAAAAVLALAMTAVVIGGSVLAVRAVSAAYTAHATPDSPLALPRGETR
jgi:multisubunit Na+/H+ antiporter MnhC subunit